MKVGSSDEIGAVGGANLAKGRVTLIVVPVSSEVSNPIVLPRVFAMSFAEYAPRPVPPCFSAVATTTLTQRATRLGPIKRLA
jgi:hypothetical protein